MNYNNNISTNSIISTYLYHMASTIATTIYINSYLKYNNIINYNSINPTNNHYNSDDSPTTTTNAICIWYHFNVFEWQGIPRHEPSTIWMVKASQGVTPQFPVLKISLNKSHEIRVRLKRSVTFHLFNNLDNNLSFTKILN